MKAPVVALAGNPNVGKSTLFNALTGSKQHTGNYPGVTVEWHVGRWALAGGSVELMDLPGSYSLIARSPDEAVVVKRLMGHPSTGPGQASSAGHHARPDALIALIDASNPERNFYLLSQLMDLGLPTVVALNMGDVAATKGLALDAARLEASLGCPVIEIQANQRLGLDALAAAVERALAQKKAAVGPGLPVEGEAASLPATIQGRYTWARQHLVDALTRSAQARRALAEKADHLLTHRVWGSLIFLALMALVFQALFAWAQPVMEAMEKSVSWLGDLALKPMPEGILRSLLADGVIAGAGSVLVFVPQIAILFLFIAILEDCGYMARGAFLMDRLFAKLGLSGRSFIPLLSSFACAVPGIMATRSIPDKKERLAAMLVAPLMSCSARLPVYTVMIAAFVPAIRLGGWLGVQALVLLAAYLIGLIVAVPIAFLLKKRLYGGTPPLFLMELPSYKWPDPRVVLHRVVEQCQAFVVQAGTVILSVSILLWALGAFPRPAAGSGPAPDAGAQLRQSYLGQMGHVVEPVFRPLGWDWRISMAAIASFPAREVVIGTLGTIFNAGSDTDANSAVLRETLRTAKRDDGRPVFNLAVALGFMVFFALCAQCVSTLAVIRRESGQWKYAAFVFTYMTALAWLGGTITYQVALKFTGA